MAWHLCCMFIDGMDKMRCDDGAIPYHTMMEDGQAWLV